jgi:alkaline phosphatase
MIRHTFFRLAAAALTAGVLFPMQGCSPKTGTEDAGPRVQNIILMVGDGMGLAQISAFMLSRDYQPVNMERTTVGGFVKTYSANNRVTDSAAGGTAYSTGQKTNNGYLGVDPAGTPLETILEKAEKAGLATGLVSTINIQHATPGAFYAHTPNRNDYSGIALGLLDAGVDVAIGGGLKYMTEREDGRNLMDELRAKGYTMTDNLAGLDGVTSGQAMALYDEGDIPKYLREGRDPMMLAKGAAKALEILTANSAANPSKGFFLMVEGSWIDSAGHGNDSEMLMGEMIDFDNAVGVALDYADAHPETLVIVLADHETGGLTLPSGRENFLLPDSGVEFRWSTGGHTATMIPMMSYGAHAAQMGGIMENTEVNHKMVRLLGLQ